MQRFWSTLHRIEEYTLTILLLGLATVACGLVFCRYALGTSFAWFEEGARYLGVVATFLGAAIGARRGDHFAMDLFVSSAGPLRAKIMRVGVGLLSAGFLMVVAGYGVKVVLRNYTFENTTAALQLPMYLVYLPIPLFAAVMAVRYLKAAYLALRQGTNRKGEAV